MSSKYHVPNLERALEILELLAKNPEGMTISQIAEALRVPRNSVFRITATLLDRGYLLRDDATKAFQLSTKLLTLAYEGLSEGTLVERAIPVMRRLRDRIGETVPLGIRTGTEGLVIAQVQGIHPFRFVLEPGRRFHLHTAAPGKALVAFLPEDEREELIARLPMPRFNERTITDPDRYREELEQVRRLGYAVDRAEETEGMHCVAACVLDRFGYPLAAIWVTGPSSRMPEGEFDNVGPIVRDHAERISRSLGGVL